MRTWRKRMKKIYYHLMGHGKQRLPYRTSQSLALGSTVSKLGRVVGWGWEGNDFVVHVA
jgi:hypothetical protein